MLAGSIGRDSPAEGAFCLSDNLVHTIDVNLDVSLSRLLLPPAGGVGEGIASERGCPDDSALGGAKAIAGRGK